ncbi:MAG: T9SS type A sorting domain-containing protein [Lewinellaceae bacterium]|nr:T9SS type A sorting domain-containing protein [Lewinellaceae bacterium]
MRQFITLLFVLSIPIFSFAQLEEINDICSKGLNERMVKPQDANRSLLSSDNYDLTYYKCVWQIDPNQYYIIGDVTPHFKVLENGLSELNFDFSTLLAVDSIMYHGQKIDYEQLGNYQLTVKLPSPLNQNTIDSITISYQGAPPSSGFGSFFADTHEGEAALWTLSEPFGSQDWWPCKNGLTDKLDSIDITVITPSKYRAASNGLLVEETTNNIGFSTYHWKHRYPIAPYLVAISVTNYLVYTDDVVLRDGQPMTMLNYVYPETEASAKAGTKVNAQVLQYFDSLFVKYPFSKEKYGHAQFKWGGGMEHQTMSYVSGFSFGLLSHELAHQWFGDYVTCGSWEDIWLNEGFATYLEGLSQRRFNGPAAWISWKTSKINSVTSNFSGSVKVDNVLSVNRIFSGRLSYNKGSYLLHMLNFILGEETFFEGLRDYLNAKQYNYAVTPDLQSYLEARSGVDLDEFFNDWFVGEGFPQYDIVWQHKPDGKLYIQAFQTTSHPSVGFYEMPLPFRIETSAGVKNVIFNHEYSGQIFEIELADEIQSIKFNDELQIMCTSQVSEGNVTSTTDNSLDSESVVYPNPATDHIFLKHAVEGTPWEIYDNLGKKVLYGKWEKGAIDLRSLNSGMYNLKMTEQNGRIRQTQLIKI